MSGQAPGCASMCVSVEVASDNCPLDSGCPNPDPCPHKAGSGQSHVCPGFLARHISSFHPSRIGRISPQPAGHCDRVSPNPDNAHAVEVAGLSRLSCLNHHSQPVGRAISVCRRKRRQIAICGRFPDPVRCVIVAVAGLISLRTRYRPPQRSAPCCAPEDSRGKALIVGLVTPATRI